MRVHTLLLVLALAATTSAWSQDVITKKNGDTIRAKVLKVTPDNIEYRLQDQPHTMPVSDIRDITYENGTKDNFSDAANGVKINPTGIFTLAERGAIDAKMYYRGGRRAFTGGALSALYPGYGLISVAIIASTKPRYETLNYPDAELMEKPEYNEAYRRKAFQIKRGKAWEGFGIVTGAMATIIAGVIIGVSSYH